MKTQKMMKMLQRRNQLLEKILDISKTIIRAVDEGQIDYVLQTMDEKEACLDELLLMHEDIKSSAVIGAMQDSVGELDETAKNLSKEICELENDTRNKLISRLNDKAAELNSLNKGRDTLRAYSTSADIPEGGEVNRHG